MTASSAGELLERAADLRRAGRPFVLATVVRAVRPASARAGDRALLLAGQPADGWVGGGCVQTSIEREAAQVLADGRPRLVRLGPAPSDTVEEGVVSYPMTCHSGGTLEVYLEPVLPSPELVVLGDSPVAESLAALAAPLGFRVQTSLEALRGAQAWVVIAGMSSGDDDPLVREALRHEGVVYVALVASRRRAEALLSELRTEGFGDDMLERLKAPAGLDIGAATGAEIALSILAEIVQRRRARTPGPLPSRVAAPAPPATAIDPICGMEVEIATARWTAERDGQTFYFCAPGCRRAFVAAPAHAGSVAG
jgi:xanthine dehydrogenase accessory factor